jgi:4-oxalocrotonate tautomerase
MPYVNVKIVGTLTRDQKLKIADQISETLEIVADKPKEHTYVVIEEIKGENWAKGGLLFG